MKPRTRAGSYRTFVRRYEPIEIEPGVIHRDWRDPDIHLAFTGGLDGRPYGHRYVWTIVDGDDGRRMYLVPGFATVNYIARVLCKKPWSDEEEGMPGYAW